jgi:hypothetical protein
MELITRYQLPIADLKPQQINEIPVVIFATGVDITNSIYRISALTIRYPVLIIADSENLKINL